MQLKINETLIYFEKDLAKLEEFCGNFKLNKYFIVIDQNVYNFYANELVNYFKACKIVIIPSGEEHKNMETVLSICQRLLEANITRGDTIIAIGGGVATDVCGFVASILYRGIKHLMIPTTLLAMVDATMGGKCGVDFNGRKNILGSFYEPKGIYISPYFLKTLPPEQIESGLGEVVKYSFLAKDINLAKEDDLINIIKEAILIKKRYVEADFKDKGMRMCLNLGHTFGHAIELKEKLLHGQTVLEGIAMIFDLETDLGLDVKAEKELFERLLTKYNLHIHHYDYKNYLDDIFKDKKNFNGTLNLVFVKDFMPYLYPVTRGDLDDKIKL